MSALNNAKISIFNLACADTKKDTDLRNPEIPQNSHRQMPLF